MKQQKKKVPTQKKLTLKTWVHNIAIVFSMVAIVVLSFSFLYTRALSDKSLKASALTVLENVDVDGALTEAEDLYLGKHHIVQILTDADFRRIFCLIYQDRILYNLGVTEAFTYPDIDSTMDEIFKIVYDYSDLTETKSVQAQTLFITNLTGLSDLLLQENSEGGRFKALSNLYPNITPTEIEELTFITQLLYSKLAIIISGVTALIFLILNALTAPNLPLMMKDVSKATLIPIIVILAIFTNAYDVNSIPFLHTAYIDTFWAAGITIGVMILARALGEIWLYKHTKQRLGKSKKKNSK